MQDWDALGDTFNAPLATGESDPLPILPVQAYDAVAAFVVLHEARLLCPALIFAGVNRKLHDAPRLLTRILAEHTAVLPVLVCNVVVHVCDSVTCHVPVEGDINPA